MKKKLPGPQIKRLIIVLMLLGLAAITAILIGGPLVFWSLLAWLVNKTVLSTGMNIWLARGLMVPVAALLFYAITLVFSLKKRKRITGAVLLCVFLCLGSLAMYNFTKEQHFKVKNNESVQWYSKASDGYRLYSHSGFDPITGEKLQKVTPEIAREIEARKQSKNEIIKPIREEYQFFDFWGRPIRWYYKNAKGRIEIFNQPGSHPTYGERLILINKEIVKEYLGQLEKEKAEKMALEKTLAPKQTPVYAQPFKQTDSPEKSVTRDEKKKPVDTPTNTDQLTVDQPEQETEIKNFENEKPIPQDFKKTLAKYGKWTEDTDYGQVWVPDTNKKRDWKPYQDGAWQNHDDENLFFLSFEEPFGSIVFHYGRWQWSPSLRWYWIPGNVWGPAWVNWYQRGDYVYWSPMCQDNQYYNRYQRDYNRSSSRFWTSVHKNQLRSPNLSRITRTNRTPLINIGPNGVAPNIRTTNAPKSPRFQFLRSPVSSKSHSTPTRSFSKPRSVSAPQKNNIQKKQSPTPIKKKASSQPVKKKEPPPPTNKRSSLDKRRQEKLTAFLLFKISFSEESIFAETTFPPMAG
jgi:hypothetical protein